MSRKNNKVYRQADPKLLYEVVLVGEILNQISERCHAGNLVDKLVLQELVEINRTLKALLC